MLNSISGQKITGPMRGQIGTYLAGSFLEAVGEDTVVVGLTYSQAINPERLDVAFLITNFMSY